MGSKKIIARGFTLIEILLVVVIIGVLAAMIIPNFAGKSHEAKIAAARTDIEANMATGLDMYEVENGGYPTTEQGLLALLQKPLISPVPEHWKGPYLKKKRLPQDPWRNLYVYRCPGVHNPESYDLYSLGPDKKESADDIVNWVRDGEE